jgi:hypothetical protein
MNHVFRSRVIAAPLRTVYNTWTLFEDFPRFLGGRFAMCQMDEMRSKWRVRIGGRRIKSRVDISNRFLISSRRSYL